MGRFLNHLSFPRWRVFRAFPKATLKLVEQAIKDSEHVHEGELRFVVEGCLDLPFLLRGITARRRAEQLFARLGLRHTKHANGVLIYVQLADRRVEVLADSGIDARVGRACWEGICKMMEEAFRSGRYREGALLGIAEITKVLAEHFPAQGANPNELADEPVIL